MKKLKLTTRLTTEEYKGESVKDVLIKDPQFIKDIADSGEAFLTREVHLSMCLCLMHYGIRLKSSDIGVLSLPSFVNFIMKCAVDNCVFGTRNELVTKDVKMAFYQVLESDHLIKSFNYVSDDQFHSIIQKFPMRSILNSAYGAVKDDNINHTTWFVAYSKDYSKVSQLPARIRGWIDELENVIWNINFFKRKPYEKWGTW